MHFTVLRLMCYILGTYKPGSLRTFALLEGVQATTEKLLSTLGRGATRLKYTIRLSFHVGTLKQIPCQERAFG